MTAAMSRVLEYLDASGTGHEVVSVEPGVHGVTLRGRVRGPHDITSKVGDPFEIDYVVEVDASWATTMVSLRDRTSGATLDLRADGAGRWTDADGAAVRALDGVLDVDISATPVTNTLPIRRLGLGVGEAADIVTAHISVPGLTVAADPQRYTRLSGSVYRYESRDSDFTSDVTVDEHDFVLEYPGLFTRSR